MYFFQRQNLFFLTLLGYSHALIPPACFMIYGKIKELVFTSVSLTIELKGLYSKVCNLHDLKFIATSYVYFHPVFICMFSFYYLLSCYMQFSIQNFFSFKNFFVIRKAVR